MDSRSVQPNIAIAILLAVLLALAGCTSGGNGGDTTTVPDTPTPTPAPGPAETTVPAPTTPSERTTAGPDPTTTPEPTTLAPNEDPLGVQHEAQLRAAGSYTTDLDIRFESVDEPNRSVLLIDRTAAVVVDGPAFQNLTVRVRSVRAVDGSTRQINASSSDLTYTDSTETFRRSSSTLASTQYGYGVEPYNGSDPSPVNTSGVSGRALFGEQRIDWERVGTTRFDGETMTEYGVDSTADIPEFDQWIGTSFETVETVNATLLVDEDGVVRLVTMTVSGVSSSGATSTISLRLTVSDLGSTTVTLPDWLDTARRKG